MSPCIMSCMRILVTLHVSVWVEILLYYRSHEILSVTLHVSVWVEITQILPWQSRDMVTLHVSVWVEIMGGYTHANYMYVTLHVSVWVEIQRIFWKTAIFLSRSTWACELKSLSVISSKASSCHAPRERVSWNYEVHNGEETVDSHAPRERVSWNWAVMTRDQHDHVTLHVSVWVEIHLW